MTISLKSIFVENKTQLTESLKGLSLPKDAQKIQEIVSDFLGNLFENNGDYRQSLTESEDYILQAALRLLQSQQSITNEIVRVAEQSRNQDSPNTSHSTGSPNPYYAIAGAGVGAIAGGLAGTWAAVAGAIAGSAIVIYCSAKKQTTHSEKTPQIQHQVNAEVFSGIVENICQNIDGVIETYRVQAKRIRDVYESREVPALETEYSSLLEQVLNTYKTIKANSDNVPDKVVHAVDALAESLENYGLKIEDGKIIKD